MTKQFTHPLETLLNLDPSDNSLDIETEYAVATAAPVPAPAPTEKDDEYVEVDKKIDTVYDAALAAFKNQTEYTEIIEPRYAARNAEVAANYLNIALNAAATRARVKTDRRRASGFAPFNNGGKTTNNFIVADRNEILRMVQVDDEKKELK